MAVCRSESWLECKIQAQCELPDLIRQKEWSFAKSVLDNSLGFFIE